MSNTASANTVADNLTHQIVNLPPSREFIADFQDGVFQGKTLQLTESQMIELIKPYVDKEHELMKFDKKVQKTTKNTKKTIKNDEKCVENNKKTPRFAKIKNKKEGEI